MSDDAPLDGPIAGRADFRDGVRRVLAEAAARGWHELRFCDPDYVGWPLDDAAVLAALGAWLRPRRRLLLLAARYDEVARRHPRWTAWRRTWSHAVACRQVADEISPADLPTLLLVPGECALRLFDRLRHRGIVTTAQGDIAAARLEFDAFSQQSGEAFGPTTLGI